MHMVINSVIVGVLFFSISSLSFANTDFNDSSGPDFIDSYGPIKDTASRICKLRAQFRSIEGANIIRDYVASFDEYDGCDLGSFVRLRTPIFNHDLELVRRFLLQNGLANYLLDSCENRQESTDSLRYCDVIDEFEMGLGDLAEFPYSVGLRTNPAPGLEIDFVFILFAGTTTHIEIVFSVTNDRVELREFSVWM